MLGPVALCALALATPSSWVRAGDDLTINFNVLLTPADFSMTCADYAWIDQGACADLTSAPVAGPAFLWVVVSASNGFDGGERS